MGTEFREVMYLDSSFINNNIIHILFYLSGPITSQTVTPTPAPSIRITNRSNQTISFGLMVVEGPIGATYSVRERITVLIKAAYEFQNADNSDVSTSWFFNGSPIPSVFIFEGTIDGAPYRSHSFDLGTMTGFIHQAVNSLDEIIELNQLPLQSNSQIRFEVSY